MFVSPCIPHVYVRMKPCVYFHVKHLAQAKFLIKCMSITRGCNTNKELHRIICKKSVSQLNMDKKNIHMSIVLEYGQKRSKEKNNIDYLPRLYLSNFNYFFLKLLSSATARDRRLV